MKISSKIYQVLLTVYNLAPFQRELAYLLRFLPINLERFYKDLRFNGTFKVTTDSGAFLLNHIGTKIENELFWNGINESHEKDTLWCWLHYSKTENFIFDIGANTGVYSMAAKAQNPHAKVYAFEPSDKMFEPLSQNNKLNGFDVVCEKIAISNSSKSQVFFDLKDPKFSASGSLDSGKEKDRTPNQENIVEYTVKCSTLDEYIESHEIKKVNLIKVDVELHEPAVFEGFKMLQDFRPIIVVEVLTQDVGNKISAACNLSGYDIYKLVAPHQVIKMDSIVADEKYRNFLFLPVEKELPNNTVILSASCAE